MRRRKKEKRVVMGMLCFQDVQVDLDSPVQWGVCRKNLKGERIVKEHIKSEEASECEKGEQLALEVQTLYSWNKEKYFCSDYGDV